MTASKPLTAAKAEAKSVMHPFTFDGEDYEVAPTSEWDIEAVEAFEDEKIIAAVRALLGLEQWKKFKQKKRSVADLTALFETISAAVGIQGNS